MPTAPYKALDFKGLTPAVEPTRSQDIYALSGKNYIFDSVGPKSVFGDRYLLPQQIGNPAHAQGVRLKLRDRDRIFHFFADGIYEWDEDLGGYRAIYLTPDTSVQPYRWTWVYLNDVMYFNHPITGIIAYDLFEDECVKLEAPGTPTEVLWICECNGRLVAMTTLYAAWSEQSNGRAWAPSLGGAGFQLISDRLPGFPIACTSYAKGFLVWTSGGVMRAEFTGDSAVFRFRALNTEFRLVNPFCTINTDENTVVILDERGLFQSKGELPTPYAPLFNEFLIGFLQDNDLNIEQNCRLEWDELRRLLFVSVSMSRYDPIYEQCFVLYPPMDKWGQFDDKHYGILPIKIHDSDRADDFYGFVDETARVKRWMRTGSREVLPTNTTLNLYYPAIQKPFKQSFGDEGITLSSSLTMNTFNRHEHFGEVAGFYPLDGHDLAPATLTGLDAWIRIGLLRADGEIGNDEMTEVTQTLVRSNISGPADVVGLDYNLTPSEPGQDYNDSTGTQNFGTEPLNYVNSKIRIISTIDGESEFQSAEQELVGFVKGGRYYAGTSVGLWHVLEIRAEEVGEAFFLRSFELTWAYAGRLM